MEALIALKSFLELHGIQFIIQVIPFYRDIAALVLNPDFQQFEDQQSAVVVKQLLESGIEAQYISDEIVKHAFDYERIYDYPTDNHPDLGTTEIMTSLMAERLSLYNFPQKLNPSLFSREIQDAFIGIYFLWPSEVNIGEHNPGERVKVPQIRYNSNTISPDPESKIFVLGNSFVVTPYNNAYISYLSEKLLYTPFSKTMGGNGVVTGLLKLLLLESEKYLKGKTVVVLPLGIDTLNGSTYFCNIKHLDSSLRKTSESNYTFKSSVPIRNYSPSLFPSSTNFNFIPESHRATSLLYKLIEMYPNLVLFSENQSFIEIPLPEESKPRMIEISVCPICFYGNTSFFVNNIEIQIKAKDYPIWETVQVELTDDQKTVKLFINDKQSGSSSFLLGNISFYE